MNANLEKVMSQLFAPVQGVVWDMMSNKTGIKSPEGIYTLAEGNVIELNPFDAVSAELPAYSQLVPMEQVVVGDVIISRGKPAGWIVGKNDASLAALNLEGHQTLFRPKKVSMLGVNNGITVVRSPFNFSASGTDMGQMNPMMLMALMGDKTMDSKTMMLMAMMGGAGGMGQMNPMMLLALMGDNSPFKKG